MSVLFNYYLMSMIILQLMFFKSSISGFLIVAACVMTFEARDSATKIAPTASAMQKDQVGPDTLANLFYSHVFV